MVKILFYRIKYLQRPGILASGGERVETYLEALDCFSFDSEAIWRFEDEAASEHCSDVLGIFQEALMSAHASQYQPRANGLIR